MNLPAVPDVHTNTHRPVAQLLRESARLAERVVRGEAELALRHLRDDASQTTRNVSWNLGAASLAGAGAVCLVAASVTGLATWMPWWRAFLVVGVTLLAVAALLVHFSRPRNPS